MARWETTGRVRFGGLRQGPKAGAQGLVVALFTGKAAGAATALGGQVIGGGISAGRRVVISSF